MQRLADKRMFSLFAALGIDGVIVVDAGGREVTPPAGFIALPNKTLVESLLASLQPGETLKYIGSQARHSPG